MEHIGEVILAALLGLAGALYPALRQLALAGADAFFQRAMADMQGRLSAAAGRVAGEIVVKLQGTSLRELPEALIDTGAEELKERFRDLVAKHGISDKTLKGMVAGEVGKLLANTK